MIGPEFPKPPDPAIPIWRYLTVAKFLSLLEMRALWFARLDGLQDQFEGKIPPLTKGQMQEKHIDFVQHFPDPGDQAQLRGMADRIEQDRRSQMAVNCWFAGEYESQEMWDEYVGCTEGVVIESSPERLRRSMKLSPEFSRFGMVEYINFDEEDIGTYRGHQFFDPAFLKRACYSFEHELRVSMMNWIMPDCLNSDGSPPSPQQRAGIGLSDPARSGLYVKTNLHVLVERIRVAPGSAAWFERAVGDVCRRYAMPLQVCRSMLESSSVG